MTRRRRAALLLGLALLLGTLAATHVARREAALSARLGPLRDVLVARADLAAGHTLELGDFALRSVPDRYAPPGEPVFAASLAGRELAVAIRAGTPLSSDLIVQEPRSPTAAIERGERAVDLVASGSPDAVVPGARVDVVVTTERSDQRRGTTRVALEDVEVLAARVADPPADRGRGPPGVAVTLRTTAAQAVYLTAAQSFAADIRLLTRAPGDRRRLGELTVDDGL